MTDPHLYALVLENNRLLKALTEGFAREKARETGRPMLKRDGLACGCVGAHTPACDRLDEAHRAVMAERLTPKCPGLEGACCYAQKHDGLCRPIAEFFRPAPDSARWTLAGRLNDVSVPGETSPEQTLERLIRDAGAKLRWGCPSKPLAESDMAHVLKTGEVPPAYSATERLVRGQVADRLWALLGVKTPVDPSLDAALAQAEHVIKYGGAAGATMALLQSNARDAALEEAVSAIPLRLPTGEYAETVERIRALKSRPAPKECIVPGCVLPPGHVPHSNHRDASGKTWCTDVTDEYIASCKPAPQLSRIPGELPIHDFGWALAQMRAGKKVRRKDWADSEAWSLARADDGSFWGRASIRQFHWEHVLATDWEVVE